MDEDEATDAERISTGVAELDRVLGGGLVPASVVLVSLVLYALLVSGTTVWTVCEAAFVGLRAPWQMLARNIGFAVMARTNPQVKTAISRAVRRHSPPVPAR